MITSFGLPRPRLIYGAVLAAAAGGLLLLVYLASGPTPDPLRVSPVVFLLLLVVEMLLLLAATSRRPRVAAAARVAVFVVPLLVTLTLRAYVAFSTHDVLEWDETYYVSLAITAADGRGLYPYVFGYGQMAIMGGVGYLAYLYALAVQAAGPTVLALRTVSLAASVVGLVCLWLLVRRLYGSGAAWIAASIASALRLFVSSNTARMDSLAFAWVAGSLLLVARAFSPSATKRSHLLAGLAFGLGLQVHIDTVVTAVACGLVYVFGWLREIHAARRFSFPAPLLLYATGWGLGLALFVAFNVLPDPDAFYRTTVLIRVDATSWYSSGTSSLAGSFLDPRILWAKETARYALLFQALHWLEIALAAAAVAALVIRRGSVDLRVLTVVAGVLVVAAIVLNNASPLYFVHVTPALIVPMAPLFSHGLTRADKIRLADLSHGSLLAFAVVIAALCAVNNAKTVRAQQTAVTGADAELVATARSSVGRQCRVAGDGGLFVRHFADYPYFVSARPTEVQYAMIFHGLTSEAAYWDLKAPEAVVMREPLSEGLGQYVKQRGLAYAGDGVWTSPRGCANLP